MKKKFNVLEYDFNGRKIKYYDILPYFRNVYKQDKPKFKNKSELQKWIKNMSLYQFWSRCEYEFIMLPWPYNETTLYKDMLKIDVHEQILMNIDIITEILAEEFLR